jgi:glycosyltransferase involved in cell wall biosynthesis
MREGLSVALLEAMAAGKPTVATTIGSNSEVIRHGETGMLIPARRPGPLAESVLVLARDEGLRKRMGTAARREFVARYTEQHMLEEYAAEYAALCSAKGVLQQAATRA